MNTLIGNAPDNLNLQAWEDWITWRRLAKFKKYKTDAMAKKLSILSHDQQLKCVEYSTTNEYMGLFPERFNNENSARISESINFESTDWELPAGYANAKRARSI